MYSLTFCIRFMLPERHQWKPAVQAAAVMLRTPPINGQSPASHAHFPYTARNFENAPVTSQSPASSAHTTPRRAFALCRHIAGWTQACNWGSHYVAIATQPDCKSAQQCTTRGLLYHAPKLHPGPCSSVGVRPRTDRHTDTQTRVTTIHFGSSTTHAKCN